MAKKNTYKALKAVYKDKNTYILFGLSALFWVLVFLLFVKQPPMVLVRDGEVQEFTTYDDAIDQGSSKVTKVNTTDAGLELEYILNNGFSNPYIGVNFNQFKTPQDVSVYDAVHITIKAAGPDNVQLFLTTKDKNVKDSSHRLAHRHSAYSLVLKDKQLQYNIPLEEFVTAGWWYEAVGQAVNDFGPIELDKMMGIAISTGYSPVIGKSQKLVIGALYFYKDYTFFFVLVGILELLLMLYLFFRYFLLLRKSGSKLEIIYKPMENVEEKGKGFLVYIQTHYANSELSLTQVAKACGVAERVISKTIADQFYCNFKTYVNNIRVEEAKRLLRTSSMNVSEIGYKVGFNSPSTFTKVFKKITAQSPSDYALKNAE